MGKIHEQLFRLQHIEELWHKLGDTTINPETEEIETEFNGFPTGTGRNMGMVRGRFRYTVAEDLMGL